MQIHGRGSAGDLANSRNPENPRRKQVTQLDLFISITGLRSCASPALRSRISSSHSVAKEYSAQALVMWVRRGCFMRTAGHFLTFALAQRLHLWLTPLTVDTPIFRGGTDYTGV